MKKIYYLICIVLFVIISIQFKAHAPQIKQQIAPDPMTVNTYDRGQCTAYVFDKVKKDKNMIERNWHDAKYWAEKAERDGYEVNQQPKKGALLQSPRGQQGHVAYIEKVYNNGSIKVSEMNYVKPYEITERTLTKLDVKRYQVIHPKDNPKY